MLGIMIWFCTLSFILGSVMASAMTCLGDRMAAGESWTRGRSHCDVCGHELELRDLVPIVSYIAGHGRCRYCGAKLSRKYLITELLMGALFTVIFLKEGMINAAVIRSWGVASGLLALSITDLDSYVIPDRLIIFLIVWWGVTTLIEWRMGTALIPMLWESLIGAVGVAGFVLVMSLIMDKVTGKETMGGGDIKLLFAAGLYTGIFGSLLMIIAACLIGLLFMVIFKRRKIPFGPSISLAVILTLLFGQGLINWYIGLLV